MRSEPESAQTLRLFSFAGSNAEPRPDISGCHLRIWLGRTGHGQQRKPKASPGLGLCRAFDNLLG